MFESQSQQHRHSEGDKKMFIGSVQVEREIHISTMESSEMEHEVGDGLRNYTGEETSKLDAEKHQLRWMLKANSGEEKQTCCFLQTEEKSIGQESDRDVPAVLGGDACVK